MVIGYRETFPRRHKNAGEEMPTHFEAKVLDGSKRHTLREYTAYKYGRWKKVEYIHHAVRNRTTKRRVFRVQENPKNVQIVRLKMTEFGRIDVYILDEPTGGLRKLNNEQRQAFIANDGFDSEKEFTEWFAYDVGRGMGDYVLIHFYRNFRY